MVRTMAIAALCTGLALPVMADGIVVEDAYARASTSMSLAGAAFMVLRNDSGTDDRLVSASAPTVAKRVELHTHQEDGDGVMRMVEVAEGFVLPAGGARALERGGDHVMLMGLTTSLTEGVTFPLTLVFEQAGEVTVEVPVDLDRMPAGHGMGSGTTITTAAEPV